MLPLEDRDWLEDFRIPLASNYIAEFQAEVGDSLVFTAPKIAVALVMPLVGILAGAGGGVMASGALWANWQAVVGFLLILPAVWWSSRKLVKLALGPAAEWQASMVFFLVFMMGVSVAVSAGWFESRWAYVAAGAAGFFFGLVYLEPTPLGKSDTWVAAGVLLGPLATGIGTYVARHAGDASMASVAMSGAIAGAVFSVPMMALLAAQWDNSRGLGHLAILFLHNDQWLAKSAAYLTRALATAPSSTELLALRGLAWSRLGDTARADADWRRACELDPAFTEADRHRADELVRRGESAAAIALLKHLLGRSPEDIEVHGSLGIALAAAREDELALTHLNRAIKRRSRRPSHYAARAELRLRLGRPGDASNDCKRALDVYPELARAHLLWGHAHRMQGNDAAAAKHYRAVLEDAVDPVDAAEARRGLEELGRSENESPEEESSEEERSRD